MQPKLFALLGGAWHDFSSFERWLAPVAESAGFALGTSSDPSQLDELLLNEPDVLLLYNCLDADDNLAYGESQVDSLVGWVERGGGLLALHSATVAARTCPRLRDLLGAVFVDHPPQSEILVEPFGSTHPMNLGIEPFRVFDELYQHDLASDLEVHLVAGIGGETQPVGWTRRVSMGQIAYVGLGHDSGVWGHPSFSKVFNQTLAWLVTGAPGPAIER